MDYKVTDTELTGIADAIRMKGETAAPLTFPNGFTSAINAIPTGGIIPTGTKSITANGDYDVNAFASAHVSVPTGVFPTGTTTITQNGTYDVTNFASASVNVSGGDDNLGKLIMRSISGTLVENSIASVGPYAFYNCGLLKKVECNSAWAVEQYAFNWCGVSEVSLPNCTFIGSYAFANCDKLTSVYLPLASNIGRECFKDCIKLSSISFSGGTILSSAFRGCSKLESLTLTSSSVTRLYASNAFDFTPFETSSYLGHFGSIFVPSSLYNVYIASTNWSYFSSRFVSV